LTSDEILDLIEAIWLPLDPDRAVEWREAMTGMDLGIAQEAILVLRDASSVKPSVKLFEATYRGLHATAVVTAAMAAVLSAVAATWAATASESADMVSISSLSSWRSVLENRILKDTTALGGSAFRWKDPTHSALR
jgi:hypothetical protein